MRKLCMLLVLFVALGAKAQNADSLFIRQLSNVIMGKGYAYDKLRELCKQIGPRLTGSRQMFAAETWGAKSFADMQGVQVRLQPCKIKRWVRGNIDNAYILVEGKRMVRLDATALGNSMGSGKAGVTAAPILINTYAELEQRKEEVKGKIVFYNADMPSVEVQPFNAYGSTGIFRRSGASRAAKYGAVGIIIRSLSTGTDNHPHTGVMSYNDSFPKIPAMAMGLQDADKVVALFKSGKPMTMTLMSDGRFLTDTTGNNVIGEIKGTEFPNEIITVGGHLDSWDLAEGAHDDGAGCVQSMQVLKALLELGYKPKRTIRAVLFCNEENGGAGGDEYFEAAKRNNEKHLFALESDAGGFTPRGFSVSTSVEDSRLKKLQSYLPLLSPFGVETIGKGGDGADISDLKALGTLTSGFRPDAQRYFDVHHARSDVFENVNKRELLLGAVNMAALIYLVDKYGL
jgi:carboxypeptidase Q